jgi:hypothetical protein
VSAIVVADGPLWPIDRADIMDCAIFAAGTLPASVSKWLPDNGEKERKAHEIIRVDFLKYFRSFRHGSRVVSDAVT